MSDFNIPKRLHLDDKDRHALSVLLSAGGAVKAPSISTIDLRMTLDRLADHGLLAKVGGMLVITMWGLRAIGKSMADGVDYRAADLGAEAIALIEKYEEENGR